MKDNSQRALKKGTKHYAKKSLGQNFLIDPNIARWMVDFAEIGDSDVILEVGPGKGMLTKEILKSPCKYLHVIEIDKTLAPFLEPLISEYESRMGLFWGGGLLVKQKDPPPPPQKGWLP